MNKIKPVIYLFLLLVFVFVIVLSSLIVIASVKNYSPPETVVISESVKPDTIKITDTLSALTWNIGYCGLGSDMDFFYEGGKQVRCNERRVYENMRFILSDLVNFNNLDFYLLQEVDELSKRSYRTNQVVAISDTLKDYTSNFALNYHVFMVPMPFNNPYGKVSSGLLNVSKYSDESSVRYSYPGNYSWPQSMFMLDRCFLVNTYPLSNGKKLLVVNTHNSAFDDGTLRKQQMAYLKEYVSKQYHNGNYVVVGGDWNQCPPDFKAEFNNHHFDTVMVSYISNDFLPGWQWVYQNNIPTNRRLNEIYRQGKTATTIVDFYLLSPNLISTFIQTVDLNFENSDHQPVLLNFTFKINSNEK